MAITRSEVLGIADLAKLRFSDEDLDAFTAQFQSILDYVEQLKEIQVEGVEPTSHVALTEGFEKSLFREDDLRPSLPTQEGLANAPDPRKDYFRVPKVI